MTRLAFIAALLLAAPVHATTRSFEARFVSATDGDTVKLQLALGFQMWLDISMRMCGVDAPELKTGTPGLDARHWLQARLSKAKYVTAFIDMKTRCETNNCERRSFTRYIGAVWADGVNVNEEIIAKGYAKPHVKKCR